MKKQMSMEATNAIISEIEKKHKCLIKREFRPSVEVHRESRELTAAVPDEWIAVRDKEVKMPSGQRVTIVVGDLAQQKVYLSCYDAIFFYVAYLYGVPLKITLF
jgi:hypothetical protein